MKPNGPLERMVRMTKIKEKEGWIFFLSTTATQSKTVHGNCI